MELAESFLFQQLENASQQFSGSLRLCWAKVEPLLRHAPSTQPTFTSHGPDHAIALVGILDKAIHPLRDDILPTDQELYVLLSATLLHDIGMVGSVGSTSNHRDNIRANHHLRTAAYIRANWESLHIIREYTNAIADVAAAHRNIDIQRDIRDRPIGSDSPHVPRVQLCAGLLRLADELHITADRVPEDYSLLELPDDSVRHFKGHLAVSGQLFDNKTGEIQLSTDVDTEDQAKFLCDCREKIDRELADLQPLFENAGVPYKRVVWNENRDPVIRYRILRALLIHGSSDVRQLCEETKECEDDVHRYLRMQGQSPPFLCESGDESGPYRLDACEDTLMNLAEEFLAKPQRQDDPLVFVRSLLCSQVLTDEYLTSLVDDRIDRMQDTRPVFRIIRESPSALHFILHHGKNLPKRGLSRKTGLYNSLVGKLEEDFSRFPDLLLSPGLIEDAFGSEPNNKDLRDHWRIQRTVEYFKAFDEDVICEQWVVQNERDRRTLLTKSEEDIESLTLHMKGPTEQIQHSHLMFAAARRLRLKLDIQGSSSISLKVTQPLIAESRTVKLPQDISMFSIDSSTCNGIFSGGFPCHLKAQSNGDWCLEIGWGATTPPTEWTAPMTAHMDFQSMGKHHEDGKQEIKGSFSGYGLNYELLDCDVAARLLDAENGSGIRFLINLTGESDFPPKEISGEFRPSLDLKCELHEFIQKMATIQRLSGERIAVPFAGIPDGITEWVAGLTVKDANDATRILKQLRDRIDDSGKPRISPIVLEIEGAGGILDHQFLDLYEGIHQPRMDFKFEDTKGKDNSTIIKQHLDNPAATILFVQPIKISPQAAAIFLQENRIEGNERDFCHPGVLARMRAQCAAECSTEARFSYEPMQEHFWYSLTPLKCVFRSFKPAQRWLTEAQELYKEKGDVRRAYVAAVEACYIDPQDSDILPSVAWYAFLSDQINEAIQINERLLADEKYFPAVINLGLAHLRGAKLCPSEIEQHVESARSRYQKAVGRLKEMDVSDALTKIEESIDDLQRFKDKIHSSACEHIQAMIELRNEISGVERGSSG